MVIGLAFTGTIAATDRDGGGAAPVPGDGPEWNDIGAEVSEEGITKAVITLDGQPDGTDRLVVIELDDDGNWTEPIMHTADGLELTMEGLEPETSYDVSVQALDEDGNISTDGPVLSVETGEADEFDWPDKAQLEVSAVTDRTATLTWDAAEPANEAGFYYLIVTEKEEGVPVGTPTFERDQNGNFTAYDGELTVENDQFTYETGEILAPETEYEFQVISQLGDHQTDPLTASGTTADAAPPEWDDGVSATVEQSTESSAAVTIDDYPIAFEDFDELVFYDGDGTEIDAHALSDLEYELEGLTANTPYEVTVEVRDRFGQESADGPTVEFTTSAAEGPHDVSADASRTNVTLTWEGPDTGTYVISRNGNVVETLDAESLTEFAYEDSGLEPAVEYEYEIVREIDGEVSGTVSDTAVTSFVGATAKASVREDGSSSGQNDRAWESELSGDGRYMVYAGGQIEDRLERIYRVDLETGERERVSVHGPDEFTFETPFRQPTVSADGNHVAFSTGRSYERNQVYVRDIAANETELVSYHEDAFGDKFEGDSSSLNPSISADGRYVAFESEATDLVDESVDGTNLFVYDRSEDEMHLIEVNESEGTLQPDISPDGSHVAFESDEFRTDDMPEDVPDEQANVFLYDLSTTEFVWVSKPNKGDVPDGSSTQPAVAAGGEYVAFQSNADSLTADEIDSTTSSTGTYRYNSTIDTVELVSIDNDGNALTPRWSPAITPDGRYVATNRYHFDTETGVMTDFAYNNAGDRWEWSYTGGTISTRDMSISDDGMTVGYRVSPFGSNVPNLVPGDDGNDDAYVTYLGDDSVLEPPSWDDNADLETSNVQAGTLDLGWDAEDGAKFYHVYVDDELFTTTSSQTTETVIEDLGQGTTYDLRVEAMNERGIVSESGPSTSQTMAELEAPSSIRTMPYDTGVLVTWSDDMEGGEIWAAEFYADGESRGYGDEDEGWFLDTGLEPDTAYDYEIVFYDGYYADGEYNTVTALAAVTTAAEGGGIETELLDRSADGEPLSRHSRNPDQTSDGNAVVFESRADVFDLPNEAHFRQIYLRSVEDDSLELISRPDGAGTDVAGDGSNRLPRISADGSSVVFRSSSDNLDDSVERESGSSWQLYVRDRATDTTRQITQIDGESADSRIHSEYDVSRDGERIVFSTRATNLHSDADGDATQVYLADRTTGEITLVSTGIDASPADDDADNPLISHNGEYVTFSSDATNLVEGVTNDQDDIYRYEVETGTVERVSVTADGEEIPYPDPDSFWGDDARSPAIDATGETIAFLSRSEALGSDGDDYQIFIWSEETGTTESVEVATTSFADYEVETGELSLSPDGRFVAFESSSSIAVPRASEADTHLYVYDRTTGYTMRADVNSMGEPASETHAGNIRLADTNTPTLLYTSGATSLHDDLGDGTSDDKVFRTELSRFYAVSDVDPPSWAPGTELETVPVGQEAIQLNWEHAVHETGVDSYVIESDELEDTVVVSGDETSMIIEGLTSDTTYTFEVYAEDAGGQQSPALTGTETTLSEDDVVTLLADVDGGVVTLSWEAATAETGVQGYLIQHREPGGDWTDRATIDDRETVEATDAGLRSNTTFDYRVLRLGGDGETRPHTTVATIETQALVVEQAVWQVLEGERSGALVSPESEIGVTVIGKANQDVSATVNYSVWDDPAAESPVNETMTIELEEDETDPGRYDAAFTLPADTAQVSEIDATLTDGSTGVETPVSELPVTVAASVELNATWPEELEFPSNARLSIWSEEVQNGETRTFDEERTYTFDSVDTGEELRTEYRVRIRERGTNQVLYEEFHDVRAGSVVNESIEDPVESATLHVNVVDPDGQPEQWVRIRATDVATDRYLGRISSDGTDDPVEIASHRQLLAGEEIDLEIDGTSAVPYRFDTEKRIELEPGTNVVTFELEDWGEKVNLSGTVTDVDGDPVDGAQITVIQRYGESRWEGFTYTDTTGSDGEYELAVRPNGDVSLSITDQHDDDEIRDVAETTIAVGTESLEEDVVLDRERPRSIDLESITYRVPGADEPQTISSFGRSEADGLRLTVSGDGISTWRATRRGEYPYQGWVADGEEVDICVNTAPLGVSGTHCETVVMDEDDRDVGVELQVTNPDGSLASASGIVTADLRTADGTQWDGTAQDTSAWTARLYEKSGGEYSTLRTFDGTDGDVQFNLAEEGEYRLRFVGEYRGVSQFTETTFELTETDNATDLGQIEMDSEGRFGFQSGNTITGPTDPILPGSQGVVRANYENAGDGSVSDAEVSFDLPDGLSYVDGSIVHDGDAMVDEDDVSVSDGTVTLPIGTIDDGGYGSIRLEVEAEPETSGQDVEVPATISFSDGSHEDEWFGSADVQIGSISLTAPAQVSEHEVEVSGRAPAEHTVALYADSVRIGETTAAPNGYWAMSADLPAADPDHEYELQAKATSEDGSESQLTSPARVTYDPGAVELTEVRFRQSDDDAEVQNLPPIALGNIDAFLPATSEQVSFTPSSNTRFPRTMLAGLSFEFELAFDRPDDVENAYVFVDGPAGGIGEATQNADGEWEATIETDREAAWSLGEICVATNVPEESIPPTGSMPQDSDVLDDIYGNFAEECDPVANPAWKIDPSGYVYEVEPENTIPGVTTTVFEKNDDGQYEEWDAEWWGEENPQETDAAGWYGWDVPEGEWRVVYEKDGYETAYSQDVYGEIEVPPPRFDVDIPLKSLESPTVETVNRSVDNDAVTVEFTRHLDTATVSENTVFVRTTGNDSETVDATVVFPETVANPHTDSDDETLSRQVRLELNEPLAPGEYELVVRDLVESYASIPVADEHTEPIQVSEAGFLEVSVDSTNSPVTAGETVTVDVTVENVGEKTATRTIDLLDFDGTVVDSVDVELDGSDTETIELQWETTTGDDGTGTIAVASGDDAETSDVTIVDPNGSSSPGQSPSPSPGDDTGADDSEDADVDDSEDADVGDSEDADVGDSEDAEVDDSEDADVDDSEDADVDDSDESERDDADGVHEDGIASDDDDGGDDDVDDGSDDSIPGFGVQVTLLALFAIGVLAARHR
ncbi:fibronectin type III domain-containing protein [Natrarchaeobius chitinivorans]|uniref:fibronectin type III domain-containing protein n=1 Tax=Natrarchaeobius chitinivorans TaxID=1679083 RepID=UPI001404EBD8|nr:fibronectin type III domain-containing protein [Natrarchaeobius chitinivorans]